VRRATIRFTEEEWQALERVFEQAPRRLSWNAWAVMMLLRGKLMWRNSSGSQVEEIKNNG
jgi:hypothetical protein